MSASELPSPKFTTDDTPTGSTENQQKIPTAEQEEIINVFDKIVSEYDPQHADECPRIYLLTGAPGAGKSVTTRLIMETAKNIIKLLMLLHSTA